MHFKTDYYYYYYAEIKEINLKKIINKIIVLKVNLIRVCKLNGP